MLKNIVRNAKIFVKFALLKIHVYNVKKDTFIIRIVINVLKKIQVHHVKKGIFGIMIEINVLLSNYHILSKLNVLI